METLKNNSTLRINELRSSDAGIYQCEASNEHGQAQVDFLLEILQPTQLQSVNGSTKYGVLGQDVTMQVEVGEIACRLSNQVDYQAVSNSIFTGLNLRQAAKK